jgi:hypothetical protein
VPAAPALVESSICVAQRRRSDCAIATRPRCSLGHGRERAAHAPPDNTTGRHGAALLRPLAALQRRPLAKSRALTASHILTHTSLRTRVPPGLAARPTSRTPASPEKYDAAVVHAAVKTCARTWHVPGTHLARRCPPRLLTCSCPQPSQNFLCSFKANTNRTRSFFLISMRST